MEEHEFKQEQLFQSPPQRGTPGMPKHRLGRSKSDCRKYEVTNLWERHHQMKRMAIMGFGQKEIAEAIGCAPQTVGNVLNSPMMKRELELARAELDMEAFDAAKEIQRILPKSLKLLEEIIDGSQPEASLPLRAKVAMDNVSRAGYSPVVRGHIDVNHSFSKEEIEQIKRDALAAGAQLGHIYEGEFEETDHDGTSACDDAILGEDADPTDCSDECNVEPRVDGSGGSDELLNKPVCDRAEEFKDCGSGI